MAAEIVGWLTSSPRFRAFAEAHRDKIRKKLRSAADSEALRDVRAELQIARLLLADRRFEVAFEPRGFDGSGGFYERFLRLSAVFVWCEGAGEAARATIWTNRSARIPMPEPAARACHRCLLGD